MKNTYYYYSTISDNSFKNWEEFLFSLSLDKELEIELLYNLNRFKGPELLNTNPDRYTFCGILVDKHDLFIGVSKCSGKDTFIKKVGRDISLGRALKNPIAHIDLIQIYNSDTDTYKIPIHKIFLDQCYELEEKFKNKELQVIGYKKLEKIIQEEKPGSKKLNLFKRIFKSLKIND